MMYSERIYKATAFAIQVHQGDQDQRRKVTNAPYITHPLSVALIVSRVNASEDLIIAALLHDTIEDSVSEHKVTREQLSTLFGEDVARMVQDVTEPDHSVPWSERKRQSVEHISHMQKDSLLLKSADTLHNITDMIISYKEKGDDLFHYFGADKQKQLDHFSNRITALRTAWSDNPLIEDLQSQYNSLRSLWGNEVVHNE